MKSEYKLLFGCGLTACRFILQSYPIISIICSAKKLFVGSLKALKALRLQKKIYFKQNS